MSADAILSLGILGAVGWVAQRFGQRWQATSPAEAASLSWRYVVALVLLYGLGHGGLLWWATGGGRAAITEHLSYLDGAWYAHLAENGYQPLPGESPGRETACYAFFPLWPLVLRLAGAGARLVLGDPLPLPWLGALLAGGIFLTTVTLMVKERRVARPIQGMSPRRGLGLAALLFSPGAWVFVTNHTEALFLALSWGAFALAGRMTSPWQAWRPALLAGLAALTRNQGVVLAVAVAFAAVMAVGGSRWRRLATFSGVGTIAGLIYGTWPLYLWQRTGNPLAHVAAQRHWSIVDSFDEYLANLLWISDKNATHAVVFWLALVVGLGLLAREPRTRPIGLYCVLSALLMPLQGVNFAQAYRFGAVLWPLWFVAGDQIEAMIVRHWGTRRPALGRLMSNGACAGGLVSSLVVAGHYYFRVSWPY